LLLLARAEATMPGDNTQRFALGMLIDEVLDMLAILIEERQLEVDRFGTELNAKEVSADRSLLRVALLNVTHNAIKFSPIRGTLRVGLELTLDPSEQLHVTIADQGPGLTKHQIPRVFDRFYRGDDQPDKPTGTGLGLSIARLVVERSGGEISFDPKASPGARCIIRLPLSHDL